MGCSSEKQGVFYKENVLLQLQFPDAVGAYVFTLEVDHILGVVAENAGGLVLFQYNGGAVHIDLQRILFRDVQGAAQFDGQDDPPQFIYFAHNAG